MKTLTRRINEDPAGDSTPIEIKDRYLKQVIVVRKDLTMPAGKLAAMVAHAAMSFIVWRLGEVHPVDEVGYMEASGFFSADEWRWMTEFDPGLESVHQISFAKIVVSVNSEKELLDVAFNATAAGLHLDFVFDSGHSHNKKGELVCCAIGPAWPEELEPITGDLKVYR